MRKIITILLAGACTVIAGDSLSEAITKGTASLDTRVFYFDRSFDKPNTPNAKAITAGGIAKYESGDFYGFKVGAAYYGSYLLNTTKRSEGVATGLLEPVNGNNLSFLGELYARYDMGKSSVKVGRQRLSTPLAGDHDLRLLPSVYEAAVLQTKEMSDTLIETGVIKRYSGFVSKYNTFKDETGIWGKDGLAYLYIENETVKDTKLRAQYIKALDNDAVAVEEYRYADARYTPTFAKWASAELQCARNGYKNSNDSTMYGALLMAKSEFVDIASIYNKINGKPFRVIESGIMYTDWQQGYASYEPSRAWGGYTVLKPTSAVSVRIGKVWVGANEASKKDDFTESNIDIWYKIDAANKIRVRYSDKDQSSKSTPEDRKDFRVIYYFSFAK